MERLDALSVREGSDGKSYFSKIGVAFPNKDGKGYTVLLDAVPASNDGQVKVMLREPLPKDDRSGSRDRRDAQDRAGAQPAYADLDDDIGF